MRASLAREGVANPWAIGKARTYWGEGLIWSLDDLHPFGNEFCIARRHYIPVASHPYNKHQERMKREVRAVALVACGQVRSDQFHDAYGNFSEPDLAAALEIVLAFAGTGKVAQAVKITDNYGHPRKDMRELVQPDNFWGIFPSTVWTGAPEDMGKPDGRLNVEFANESLPGNHLRFSVTVKDAHVSAIEFINGTTGMGL